ncbi:hypothetical protein C4D60_Mb09t06830 [Musa balbisiana]|uniref:Uncharacterized protein n=1 Tax=Musa balbisiana TaxID=52838 RepID=A0A4S8IFC3_MUSBA|nr:hypothetical protein C4D60_Mb09t06830 [Musa balbisiana]
MWYAYAQSLKPRTHLWGKPVPQSQGRLGKINGTSKRCGFVLTFSLLIIGVAVRHNAGSSLKIQTQQLPLPSVLSAEEREHELS